MFFICLPPQREIKGLKAWDFPVLWKGLSGGVCPCCSTGSGFHPGAGAMPEQTGEKTEGITEQTCERKVPLSQIWNLSPSESVVQRCVHQSSPTLSTRSLFSIASLPKKGSKAKGCSRSACCAWQKQFPSQDSSCFSRGRGITRGFSVFFVCGVCFVFQRTLGLL